MSQYHDHLPEEFEAEHGTIDLDTKPVLGDDLELDLSATAQRVWLVKVPKFLMERWSEVQSEGQMLGRVRVYDEKDANGDPKIAVLLNDDETAGGSGDSKGKGKALPTEYRLTLQNTSSKNLFIFGEKEEARDTSLGNSDDDDDDDDPDLRRRKRRRVTKDGWND